jgi:hypothetical protein
MLKLYKDRKIYLDEHDWPSGLSDEQKSELIHGEGNKYYTGASIREPEVPEVPKVRNPYK